MSDLNFTADMSEAISEIQKVNNLTDTATQKLREWAEATVKFNGVQIGGVEVLKKTDLIIKGLISDTQELTAKLHDEGAGWEFVSSSVKEVNNSKAKLVQITRELAGINREAANQAKAAAAADEQRVQQQLRSIQAATRSNREEFQRRTESSIASVLSGNTSSVRSQLQNKKFGDSNQATDLSGAAQATVANLTQKLSQLAAAAGLSSQQFLKLFQQVKAGDFSGIEGKYANVVAAIQKYNEALSIGSKAGARNAVKPIELPTPNTENILSYLNILTRIQSTLTNLALYRGFNILTNTLTDSVSAARDLQIEVSLIRTLTQDAQQSNKQYADGIKRISNESGFAAKEIAELYYDIASNQVASGAAIENVARKAAELARIVKATPKETGNLLASVVNTYGAEAGSLEEVSAKLFKTIDLGRVTAAELQNSFGRVENTGKDLGVTFDELLASMASLTITGLKTDESMTLLFNVMKSLRNPTQEMKAALLEMGYASGPLAVKTETLFGVLKKLTGAAKEGKVDLANLFPDAREQRFIAAFTNDTKVFEDNLKRIKTEAGSTFSNAKDIRAESDADKIAKGLQVFKNAAIGTFGDSVTKLVSQFVDLTSKTEDLEKKATHLFQQVAVGVVTFTAFRTIMTVLGVIQELQAARTLRLAAATDVSTAAQVRNNAAQAAGRGGVGGLVGGSPLLAGVGLFATAATAYLSYKSIVTDGNEQLGRSYQDLLERYKQDGLSKELEKSSTEATKLKANLDEAAKSLTRTLGQGIIENQSALAALQEKIRGGADALKASFAGVASLTNDRLKDTEEVLGRIRTERERIVKQQGGHQDAANNAVYGTLQKYANPYQQFQLLDQEFIQVDRKIQALVAKGTTESFQEAEKLNDQKLKLVTEYYEKDAAFRYENFQKELAEKARLGQLTGSPGEQTFVYDPTKQIQATNRLTADREAMEKNILALLDKQQKVKEDELAKLKEAQKLQQLAIKSYEEFSVHDTNGNVKKEYQDQFGKYDPAKAKADLDTRTANLNKSLGTEDNKLLGGQDYVNRLELQKRLDDTNKLKLQEVERTKTAKDLGQAQQTVADNTNKRKELINESTKSLDAYNAAAVKELELLKAEAEALKRAAQLAPEQIHEQAIVGGITGTDKASRAKRAGIRAADKLAGTDSQIIDAITPIYNKAQTAADEIIAEIDAAQKNLKDVSNGKIIDPEEVKRLQARVYFLSTALRNIYRQQQAAERTGGPRVPAPGFKDQDPGDFGIGGIRLNEFDKTFEQDRNTFDKSQPLLQKGLDLNAQAEAVTKVTVASNDVAKSFRDLSGTTVNLQKLIEKATGATPTTREAVPNLPVTWAPVDQGDKGIQKFYGGHIDYKAYGGPIGQDRNMAWLASGESVLNRSATQRFYSRIMQMNNQSRVPQYFSEGGMVTNMGGVKFSINGAQSPKATAREIHNMLRRAKRTGSI